jgi:hypothetical protein
MVPSRINWEITNRGAVARLRYRAGFSAAGAVIGVLLGFLIELSGHRWWFVLMMVGVALAAALATSGIEILIGCRPRHSRLMPSWAKIVTVVFLVALSLAVIRIARINPRDYAYLPLVVPVIVAAACFGFGQGLLAIVLCTVVADYLFALPKYDFRITDWEDAIGLAVFGIIGATFAWCVDELLSLGDP